MGNQSLIDLASPRRSFDSRIRSLGRCFRRVVVCSLLFLLSVVSSRVSAGDGSEIPEWPHEREARLEAVESQILDVQRALFAARMSNDEAKRGELEIKMKKLEDEQVKLLRAGGHFRPE